MKKQESVFQHYEKLDVADSLSYDEAIESFEVLYKQGLKLAPPSQLAKYRDVLVGESKIRTALSKLKGGVKCTPPKLVVTGMDVRARSDLAIRRLVQSDIKNNVVPRVGVMICTEGSTGEMQATLRMSGVFTEEESSDKLMDLLRTAPGILANTEAFTEALKCISAKKEVKRSLVMPLVDIPYEMVAVESAECRAERLQREKEDLQDRLDAALKAQEEPKVPKRSRADADDPGMREGQKVAEQGEQAKAEADKLSSEANKKVIYDRIDGTLMEYDSMVRSFASTMSWFKSGRKAVVEMLEEEATAARLKKAAKAARGKKVEIVPETESDEDSTDESEAEDSEEEPPMEDMCAGLFKGCVSKKLVKAESFLSEVRVFTKGGAISMANVTNQEMLSSRAKQAADRELMRLKRDHEGVLSEWQPDLQIVREKFRSTLESYEITRLAMEKICDPGAKASAEDQAVARAMVHGELMQKEGLEGTMDMYLNLSENVRNGVDTKEVAREMMKAHLKKVRGMTVQDKEMEKTRQAAKKKLKSDGILRAVMGNVSSGDFGTDAVVRKSKKSRGRRVFSSDDESSDEAPVRSKKKKAKQEGPKKVKGQKVIGKLQCAPGKEVYGLDGYVPVLHSGGLSVELQKKAPTDWWGECNLCGTKGHRAMQCDHKVEVDGDTVYPLAYLFQKGIVDKWGVITEKGKKKKGL